MSVGQKYLRDTVNYVSQGYKKLFIDSWPSLTNLKMNFFFSMDF